jgi:hypothetical protein
MVGSAFLETLETAELLEIIISYLPPADILASVQTISKYWKAIIDGSISLRGNVSPTARCGHLLANWVDAGQKVGSLG